MHAGLIPIVSYESSVDVGDFGMILKDCTINEIKNTISTISALSLQELKQKARKAWEYARSNHTREKFAEEYRNVIDKIIIAHSNEQKTD
jgi:DNA-directed RNA polymerase subunit F